MLVIFDVGHQLYLAVEFKKTVFRKDENKKTYQSLQLFFVIERCKKFAITLIKINTYLDKHQFLKNKTKHTLHSN
jgi:hypothetical protein